MGTRCTTIPPAALFGDTDHAGSVPNAEGDDQPFEPCSCSQGSGPINALVPSSGPVYLEGRLVLSLSFKQDDLRYVPPRVPEGETLLERYRIWDSAADAWLEGGPTALRFESADVVMSTEPQPAIAWVGALDTRCVVIDVPDLDEDGFMHNQKHNLRWKRAPVQR